MDKKLFLGWMAAFLSMAFSTAAERPAGLPSADSDTTARMTVSPEPLTVDTLERLDPVDTDLVTLRRSAGGEEMVIEVAGFGITLSNSSDGWFRSADSVKNRSRFSLLFLAGSEYGFIVPTGLDYGAYPAGSDHFFDLRNGKSFHISTTLVGLNCEFGRTRQFNLRTGLRYTIDNYRLSDNSITLGSENGMIVPLTLDEKADKSKLRITSLGIPLTFSYRVARNLKVAVSGFFDFTMGVNSIYKHPKEKNTLSGANAFQFSTAVAVGYHNVGIYLRYGVTPLFKTGVGPKVHPLSIGFCLDM